MSAQSPSKIWVVAACIVVQLAFGAYGVLVKKFADNSDNSINPLIFSMYRDMGAFPILLIAAACIEGLRQPPWKDIPLLFVLGLTGMFGNQFFYILGVYFASAPVASIFQPAIPVITAILAIFVRLEPFPPINKLRGWLKIGGILACTCGAIVMVLPKVTSDSDTPKSFLLGLAALLANCCCMGVYVIIQKKFIFLPGARAAHFKQTPVTLTAWSYGFGALTMAVASLYYVVTDQFSVYYDWSYQILVPLAYSICISSALAYGLITWCNKHLSASAVTAFWPLQVPVSVYLSFLLLPDTSLSVAEVMGALLIISGLLMVTGSNILEDRERTKDSEDPGPVVHAEYERLINAGRRRDSE